MGAKVDFRTSRYCLPLRESDSDRCKGQTLPSLSLEAILELFVRQGESLQTCPTRDQLLYYSTNNVERYGAAGLLISGLGDSLQNLLQSR